MSRPAYFKLKKSSDGQYLFNLHAPNHEVIATSERYTTKRAAEDGIENVRRYVPSAEIKDDT